MTHDQRSEHTPGADEGRLERLLTGEARGRDWLALRDETEADEAVWDDLAAMADQKAVLDQAMAGVGQAAERVALPDSDAAASEPSVSLVYEGVDEVADTHERQEVSRDSRGTARLGAWRAWGGWGGWAAAAAVALSWSLTSPSAWERPAGSPSKQVVQSGTAGEPGAMDGVQVAGGGSVVRSAPEALRAYLDKGRADGWVIEELPEHVLVEAHRRPDGEVEVLYLRQILERAVVDEAYRFAEDEAGRAVPVRMETWPGLHEAL